MNNELYINGTLTPKDPTTPTHVDIYGVGGMRIVETYDEMVAIPSSFKKGGMLVQVLETNVLYKWNADDEVWDEFKITNNMVVPNSIDGDKIIDGTITPEKLINGSIDGSKIKYGTITNDKLTPESIKGENIAQNTLTSEQLGYGSIVTYVIADNSITSDKLADESISGEIIIPETIDGTKLKTHSITEDKLAPSISLIARSIQSTPVTGNYLGNNSELSVDLSDCFDSGHLGYALTFTQVTFYDAHSILSGAGSGATLTLYVANDNLYPGGDYVGATSCHLSYNGLVSEPVDGLLQTIIVAQTTDQAKLNFKLDYNKSNSEEFRIGFLPVAYVPLITTP